MMKFSKIMRYAMLFVVAIMILVPMNAVDASTFSERAASMSEITGVRISTSSEKVRVVVDGTKEVNYETKVLSNPQRIVVDLYGAWLSPKITKSIEVSSDYVSKVRIAQFDSDTVRIVIESNVGENNFDVFSLEGGAVPYRVVMDFGNVSLGSSSSGSSDSSSSSGKVIDFNAGNDNDSSDSGSVSGAANGVSQQESSNSSDEASSSSSSSSLSSGSDVIATDNGSDTYSNAKPIIGEISFTPGINGKIICIDAGHGGSDVGAIGPTGITEKSVTMRIANQLKSMLEEAGATVVMTRSTDIEVSPKRASATDIEELQARCDVANKAKADIFLSIHMDSFTNSTPCGTTGYYYGSGSKTSQHLAKLISDGVVKSLGTDSRGCRPCNFYVVKHTDMPATLCEIAFISNNKEEKLLNSDAGVKKAAQGIFNGMEEFFE